MGSNEEMQKAVSGIRMNIPKAIGVRFNFVMNDKNDEDVYLVKSDMKDRFVDKQVSDLKTNEKITTS